MQKTRYIPLTKWPDFHVWPPVSGLRSMVINSKKNGFDVVLKRVGGKLLIDEAAFFKWVEDQQVKKDD